MLLVAVKTFDPKDGRVRTQRLAMVFAVGVVMLRQGARVAGCPISLRALALDMQMAAVVAFELCLSALPLRALGNCMAL